MGVNRSHDVGHIGGRAADQRRISHAQRRIRHRIELRAQRRWVRITHLNGEAGREPGYPLQLPPFRQPWEAMGDTIEGHLPNVANHEVMAHVAGREAAAELGILEIDQMLESWLANLHSAHSRRRHWKHRYTLGR